MVLLQVIYRPRVSASEAKGGVHVQVAATAAMCQANVRADAAAGAIRYLSVVKVDGGLAASVVRGSGVVFAPFA